MNPSFTIRVYGLMLNDDKVLLSEEWYGEHHMIKFPGGGLEFGEGTVDCLVREMLEEFDMKVEVGNHFFTTDFFVPSAFHPNTQVMSIYYFMVADSSPIPVDQVFVDEQGRRSLFWVKLSDLEPDKLSFPIDKKVANKLKDKYLY